MGRGEIVACEALQKAFFQPNTTIAEKAVIARQIGSDVVVKQIADIGSDFDEVMGYRPGHGAWPNTSLVGIYI